MVVNGSIYGKSKTFHGKTAKLSCGQDAGRDADRPRDVPKVSYDMSNESSAKNTLNHHHYADYRVFE